MIININVCSVAVGSSFFYCIGLVTSILTEHEGLPLINSTRYRSNPRYMYKIPLKSQLQDSGSNHFN